MALSNSANVPTICIIILPGGVVVSSASVRLRNSRAGIAGAERDPRCRRDRFQRTVIFQMRLEQVE